MEKRKYVPKIFRDELDKLHEECFALLERGELCSKAGQPLTAIIYEYVYDRATPLLKLYMDYSSFSGDEGQLIDKNGGFMRDENGYPIQGWIVDEDRFCYDRYTGRQLFYSDGTPVIQPEMPPELKPYFQPPWD